MKRKGIRHFINNFDWWVFIPAFIASVFGIMLIYSAGIAGGTSQRDVIVQSIALLIGLIGMIISIKIDYDIFEALGFIIGGIGVGMLLLVLLIGTGGEEVGTKGWIILGPVSVQPSEFAKIAFIISMATHISRIEDKIKVNYAPSGKSGWYTVKIGNEEGETLESKRFRFVKQSDIDELLAELMTGTDISILRNLPKYLFIFLQIFT